VLACSLLACSLLACSLLACSLLACSLLACSLLACSHGGARLRAHAGLAALALGAALLSEPHRPPGKRSAPGVTPRR